MMISVIMPVYNETICELQNSINSILSQSYKDYEFIIIDDNPKSSIIRKFLLTQSKKDNRIKIYFNKKNVGAMLSANKAIKLSKGKYIARMDADDISCKNRLDDQLSFCEKYKLDFSSCNLIYVKNSVRQLFINTKNCINGKKIKRLMYYKNIATGPTLFFNRRIIKNIGGYRNILAEDYDLAMRMLVLKYKVGFLSTPLVYKIYRKNSLSEIKSFTVFIVMYLIRKYYKLNHFTKVVPLNYLYINTKLIEHYNKKRYYEFINNSLKYKHNHRINNLILKYFWAFSSLFMLKRVIIIERNKFVCLLYRHF